jgi:hypothetical protein
MMGWTGDEGDVSHPYYNDLRTLMAGTFANSDAANKVHPDCTPEHISSWKHAATKYPEFPWAHWGLAICGYNSHVPVRPAPRLT